MSITVTEEMRKAAYEKVFLSAPQYNPNNSGVNYKRPYSKTKRKKENQT